LYRSEAFHEAREFWQLGLEPFDKSYTHSKFLERFHNRKLRIKSLLLNQTFVAGVGNIYADEALFEAGIHPERLAHSLSAVEKQRLFRAIPKVLRRGLKHGGTSFQNYFNADGEAGTNQERLRVYGREGEKCPSLPNPHHANSRQPTRHTFLPPLPAHQKEVKLWQISLEFSLLGCLLKRQAEA
jgi:DNA-formamidopyrimidine glycosylase